MQYKKLFKDSWNITRKNPFLWIFGFFTVILMGAGGDFEILIKHINDIIEGNGWFYEFQSGRAREQIMLLGTQFQEFLGRYGLSAWILMALMLILGVFVIWVISAAQGSLIYSAYTLQRTKTKVNLNTAMMEGRKHAWTLFSMNLIQKALVGLTILFVTLPLAAAAQSRSADQSILALASITILILVPIAIILGFVIKYASIYAVVNNLHLGLALREAQRLFRQYWLISIEVAIVLFIIYTVMSALIVFILSIASVPFVAMSILVSDVSNAGFLLAMGLYTLIFLCVVILVASILATFEYVTWTLTFSELQKTKKLSKLHRIIHPILGGGHSEAAKKT